jgi:DNA-binding protein Fis
MSDADSLRRRLNVLDRLAADGSLEEAALCSKLAVLKEVAFALLDEVENLGHVHHINLRSGINLYEEVQRFETNLITRALERTGGNQTRAAQLLGLNLTTLHSKLKRYNLSPNPHANPATTNNPAPNQNATHTPVRPQTQLDGFSSQAARGETEPPIFLDGAHEM